MKTTILAISFFVISFVAGAQKTPPAAVTTSFSQKFQKAEKVKWSMEEKKEWEAEFMLSGKETSASFDLAGEWLETETEIEKNALPAPVQAAIDKEFAGAKIGEASQIETPGFKGYEIALKMNGKSFEVQATSDGKLKKK